MTTFATYFDPDKPSLPPIPVSLFYRKEGYSVGSLTFDLIMEEEHSLVSLISNHPSEYGTAITDHIKKQLQVGSFTGRISNYSLKTATSPGSNRAQAIIDQASGKVSTMPNRALQAYETLKRIVAASELVTIVLTLDAYPNVAVSLVNARRDGRTGEMQDFSITFQQIRTTKLQEVNISAVIQPESMTTDIDKLSSGKKSPGTVVSKSNISMANVLVKL